ncbi:RICIN domain-containing protein [Ideonella sp. DXS29W]|uniref:RICIN domain-containing protein n=1 Tax=Ideonella lacteola TaxID=2984193 RepID=A0ABU9BYQ2_9BURK
MAVAAYHGQGFIVNSSYGKCLQFAPGDLSNFVTMQLGSCGGNSAIHQQWNFLAVGNNTYLFQNAMNYTCAAVEDDSLANGARIVQRTCDMNNRSQHWIQTAKAPFGTKTRWINSLSGKCLDAWNRNNGTVLQQYDCASSSNWPQQGFHEDLFPIGS